MVKKEIVFSIILIFLVLPLISAYSYGSPMDVFNSEWAKFTLIVALLVASIYTFLNKRMRNPPVSAIISVCLSILITIPIMQRGLIDPFFGAEQVDWIVITALLVGFFFLFYKFGMRTNEYGVKRFSLLRLIVFLIILLGLLYILGDKLPESARYGPIGDAIDWMQSLSSWAIWIAVIIFIIWIFWRFIKRKTEGNLRYGRPIFGGGKKPNPPLEYHI